MAIVFWHYPIFSLQSPDITFLFNHLSKSVAAHHPHSRNDLMATQLRTSDSNITITVFTVSFESFKVIKFSVLFNGAPVSSRNISLIDGSKEEEQRGAQLMRNINGARDTILALAIDTSATKGSHVTENV